jgi:hypothetical protein
MQGRSKLKLSLIQSDAITASFSFSYGISFSLC